MISRKSQTTLLLPVRQAKQLITLERLRGRGLPCVLALPFAEPPLLLRTVVLRCPLPAFPFTTASTKTCYQHHQWCVLKVSFEPLLSLSPPMCTLLHCQPMFA